MIPGEVVGGIPAGFVKFEDPVGILELEVMFIVGSIEGNDEVAEPKLEPIEDPKPGLVDPEGTKEGMLEPIDGPMLDPIDDALPEVTDNPTLEAIDDPIPEGSD